VSRRGVIKITWTAIGTSNASAMLPSLLRLSTTKPNATNKTSLVIYTSTTVLTQESEQEKQGVEWGWKRWYHSPFRIFEWSDHEHALFTSWSLTHTLIGALQFVFIPPAWLQPKGLSWVWFLANLAIHAAFELLENTPWGIRVARWVPPRRFAQYNGDTVVNSVGDLFSFSLGYLALAFAWEQSTLAAFVTLSVFGIAGVVPFVEAVYTHSLVSR